MLNSQNLKTRFLVGSLAALTASVVIVLASLTHALASATAYV